MALSVGRMVASSSPKLGDRLNSRLATSASVRLATKAALVLAVWVCGNGPLKTSVLANGAWPRAELLAWIFTVVALTVSVPMVA